MQSDKQFIFSLLDLTNLNESVDEAGIKTLCSQASLNKTAAICVLPQFVVLAKQLLTNTKIKIATVANFPRGNCDITQVCDEIKNAIEDGADEIDVVMPYQDYLSDEKEKCIKFIATCKNICGNKTLKIILETGELKNVDTIYQASIDAIKAGANFIKTSTGKTTMGATLDAARMMLTAVKRCQQQGFDAGFKASGGIRTLQQAQTYLELAEKIMGATWITPTKFRFGTSRLLP